jgi:WD40 repeat protein
MPSSKPTPPYLGDSANASFAGVSANVSTEPERNLFSPDLFPKLHPLRKKATAASGANDLRVWRVRDGQLLHRMDVHTAGVTSVAFSRDGRMLASGSYDTTAKLWSAQNGALQYNLAYDAPVRTVAFGPDGRSLSAGGGDQKIAFWRLEPAPLNSSNTR